MFYLFYNCISILWKSRVLNVSSYTFCTGKFLLKHTLCQNSQHKESLLCSNDYIIQIMNLHKLIMYIFLFIISLREDSFGTIITEITYTMLLSFLLLTAPKVFIHQLPNHWFHHMNSHHFAAFLSAFLSVSTDRNDMF